MKFRITWGKGLNTDAPPNELPDGFMSGASNVRLRDGVVERIGGTSATYNTFTHSPTWMSLVRTSNAVNQGFMLVAASQTEVYAADPAVASVSVSNITRFTPGVTVVSATAIGTTVTITTSGAHGRTTADAISVWGFTESAYNVGQKAITVTGATTFTYVADTAPAAPASVIGLYSYNVRSNFSSMSGRKWTGGEMGGVLFINHSTDGLHYWSGSLVSPNDALRKVPRSYVSRASRPFGNYIVQLAPFMSGVQYPYRILWSTSAEPGTIPSAFDATTTNDAGLVDRTEGGECIDGLALGDDFIVYKQAGRMRMRLVGGNDIFSFDQLPGTEGLLASNCVVDTPIGHVFLSANYQVLIHNGGECRNLSEGRVSSLITVGTSRNYYLATNPAKNEVWVYIVNGSTQPTRALIWNWVDDTWGVREYGSAQIAHAVSTFFETDRNEYLMLLKSTGELALEDQTTTTMFGVSFTSYVERTGIDLEDADMVKNLQRSRWNFDAVAATTASIEHGSAMTAAATPTYASAGTYTIGTTDYVDSRATGGRFLALKATWSAAGSIRSTDIDVTMGGKR
jgi:hypothetical protein